MDEILTIAGRASGVRLVGGEELPAQAIVFNGDVAAIASGRLGSAVAAGVPPVAEARRSLSAFTLNLLAATQGFPLARHSVFFSNDYRREFDEIFKHARLPSLPTVYVCAQDRLDAGAHAPEGPERLLCIVNAPANGDAGSFTPEEIATCEAQIFRTFEHCGLRVSRTPTNALTTTPRDFERLFPATGGALYGQASHGWMASFSRPGSRSRVPGLYLAGGSTHPGPGVPMAALSGRQAAASLLADRAGARSSARPSTRPSLPAATPGGTSTP